MSEKRYKRVLLNTKEFIVADRKEMIKGNLEECSLTDDEIVDRLNEQEYEIKRLKKIIWRYEAGELESGIGGQNYD